MMKIKSYLVLWCAFRIIAVNLIFITALQLIGCVTPKPNDPAFAPTMPPAVPARQAVNGGIYQSETAISLFEDNRARHVGDILTILLEEKTAAEKDATTKITKAGGTTVANPTLFGSTPQFNVPGIVPLVSNKDNTLATTTSSSNTFNGDSELEQNNELTGTISVTVASVLPNGNLIVRGEKWIELNQGKEFIRLSGIVRPADIGPDNTISSQRVADARIAYSGTGVPADSNAMSWLSRFFVSAIWPL